MPQFLSSPSPYLLGCVMSPFHDLWDAQPVLLHLTPTPSHVFMAAHLILPTLSLSRYFSNPVPALANPRGLLTASCVFSFQLTSCGIQQTPWSPLPVHCSLHTYEQTQTGPGPWIPHPGTQSSLTGYFHTIVIQAKQAPCYSTVFSLLHDAQFSWPLSVVIPSHPYCTQTHMALHTIGTKSHRITRQLWR